MAGGKTRAQASNTGGTRSATVAWCGSPQAATTQAAGVRSVSTGRPARCTAGNLPGERTTPGLLRGAGPCGAGERHAGRLDKYRQPGGRVTVRVSLAAVRRTGDHAVARKELRTGGPSGRRLADSHLTSPISMQSTDHLLSRVPRRYDAIPGVGNGILQLSAECGSNTSGTPSASLSASSSALSRR